MSNDKFITLEQLTRTTKGLVNKVNAESIVFDSKIGNLNNLDTTTKTDLVSAINEVAAGSGGSGGSGSGAVSLPSTMGTAGQILKAPSSGTTLVWDNAPTVPSTVSSFTNDAGYLTSYTETDPTVPSWAKAANKPTYTASEVGALPDTYKPTFYVNISGNNDNGFSTDKTFDEVLTAYQNGFVVYAIYSKNIYSLYNISQTEGYNNNNPYGFMFSRAATTGIYAIAWTYLNNTTTIRYTTKTIPTVTDTYSSSSSAAMSGIAVNSAISNIVIPTNVSSLTNDAGYLTLADLPIYDGTVQNG